MESRRIETECSSCPIGGVDVAVFGKEGCEGKMFESRLASYCVNY